MQAIMIFRRQAAQPAQKILASIMIRKPDEPRLLLEASQRLKIAYAKNGSPAFAYCLATASFNSTPNPGPEGTWIAPF